MYQKATLENGIRVITEAMPHIRSTAVGIIIAAGPKQDPTGLEGLAHLTEHLMFQGTSSRDSMQIANLMDVGGGHMGGFTTRDYTCYFATVLDEYYTYALDLLGDILLNSIFPEESVSREKEAVLHEINGISDSPEMQAHDLLKERSWAGHPLSRPIVGRPEAVRRMSREELIYFVHENYTPDRVIVAGAGSLNHEDFVAQVRDALWRMLGDSEPADVSPPVFQQSIATIPMSVSQAYFSIGFEAFPYAHPDRYTLHLLNNIMGGGISSRLFRELREERGLVYNIGSEYHAYQEAGMWVIEGSTMPEYVMPVLGLTLYTLWQLMSGEAPVTADDLWKAKMQIRGQHLIAGEDSNTCMSRLATQELYFGEYISPEVVLNAIDRVDESVIGQTTAALCESLANVSLTIAGPEAPEHYSLESLQELLADFS